MYDFRECGYTVVKNVISKELCDIVTQYTFFDEMRTGSLGDIMCPNTHGQYADPMMETILLRIQSEVERNTGLTLCPTYSYYRIYGNGDDLENHTDRESCQISASLCFNHSYQDGYNWAIYMGDIPIMLDPTDMVIYRGLEVEHRREKLETNNPDDWHLQGFFHYVDVNSSEDITQWKYDKRVGVGYPEVSNSAYRFTPRVRRKRPLVIKNKY